MFGQDDQYQQPQNTPGALPAQDVPADGTLGAPASGMTNTPLAATDDGMPPYEPAATPQDAQAVRTMMATHTPEELITIKQEALQSLKPLVGHLQQSPEEKFRTTMMMIQAADDQSLIPDAYDAAKQITDEKMRAQALLDVVNEINYFTSQHAEQ